MKNKIIRQFRLFRIKNYGNVGSNVCVQGGVLHKTLYSKQFDSGIAVEERLNSYTTLIRFFLKPFEISSKVVVRRN